MLKMWEFYRASIMTYQAEAMAIQSQASEEAVLTMLDKAPAILGESTRRTALLESFKDEDGLFTPHYYSRPLLMGTYWGSSMIWNARPWLAKSERIRSRVEALAATDQQGAGSLARKMLLAEKGAVTPMLKNPSFEEGLRDWKPRIIPPSGGAFRVAEGSEDSKVLLAEGITRGLIMQDFPYQTGGYYLSLRARLPEAYRGAKVSFRFIPTGKAWRDKGYSKIAVTLPSFDLPLKAGEWTTFEFPFDLSQKNIQEIALCIDVTGFPPEGKIYLDNLQVYRTKDH